MGGDSGPKRLHAVVNRMVDYLKLDQEALRKEVLAADEQAKLRAVNTDPEVKKGLKSYLSEGRLPSDPIVTADFLRSVSAIA